MYHPAFKPAFCQGIAQYLLDAGIITFAGRPDAFHHISREPETDVHFRGLDGRPAQLFPRLVLLRKSFLERSCPRKILGGPCRVFVKIGDVQPLAALGVAQRAVERAGLARHLAERDSARI